MVSVIIPVYNGEKTIGRAVKSICNQPFVRQLILVNDASTDNTMAQLEYLRDRYFSPEKEIKLVLVNLKTNGGVSMARNKGLEYVTAPFLTFLDADDEFLPCRFCQDLPQLQNNSSMAGIYTPVRVAYESQIARTYHQKNSREMEWTGIAVHNTSLFSGFLGCKNRYFLLSGLLIRTRLIPQIGYFDPGLAFCQDTDWLLRVIASVPLLPSVDKTPRVRIWRHGENRVLTPSLPATCRRNLLWNWVPYVLTRHDFTFKQRCFFINSLLEHPSELPQSKKTKMMNALKIFIGNPKIAVWLLKG
jgi:hypothetical protein